MRRREGFTLIEMMVVLSVMSVVMLIAATAITGLMRAEARGAKSLAESLAVSELADRFREDVHAASGASVENAGRLTLPGENAPAVEYEIEAGRIIRREEAGDGKTIRDAFRVSEGGAEFAVSGEPAVVTLRIGGGRQDEEPAQPGSAPRWQIQALVGRNGGGGGP